MNTPKDMHIRAVAELAKLSLTTEEEARMTDELRDIVAFAEMLQQVDTTDIPMTAHVVPLTNVLREDEPASCIDRECLLSAAPTREDVFISVPRTVE